MNYWTKGLAVAAAVFAGTMSHAATASLAANAVIVDNAPFGTDSGEDTPFGSGNYALNLGGSFIDIPYAIFDFGGASSVSSATLSWDYLGPFSNSTPTSISLYAGTDADGVITMADRFMGSVIDSFVYLAPVSRLFDVTALVNSALASGDDFAIRLEVDADPLTFSGYLGGQFNTPSITFDTGTPAVPLPAGLPLLGGGLLVLGALRRKARKAA